MPRLSDYLRQEVADVQPPQFPTLGALPVAQVKPGASAPVQSSELFKQAGVAQQSAEALSLHRQHTSRLQARGLRLYRQTDGALTTTAPEKQPYAVANRRKWHCLVQHCRQQPGVSQQLQHTGQAARYHINTSYEQHTSALAAAGLSPEYDASGSWYGFSCALTDPLADDSHPLRHGSWGAVTSAVLQRAAEVHGGEVLFLYNWQL